MNPVLWLWLLSIGCLQSVAGLLNNGSVTMPQIQTPPQSESSAYFPSGTFNLPDGSQDERSAESLAKYLHEIGEPSFLKVAQNPNAEVYRLIVLGALTGKGIILRLDIQNDGAGRLFVKETSYDQTIVQNREESISVTAVNGFFDRVKKGEFWQLPTREHSEPSVKDGTAWFLEGVRHSRYHAVYRRAPELNPCPFTDIGRYLAIDLAQISALRIPRSDRSEPMRIEPSAKP